MTFVIVTHNAAFASKLCTRGIVLHKGQVAFDGDAQEAAAFYRQQIAGTRVSAVSA